MIKTIKNILKSMWKAYLSFHEKCFMFGYWIGEKTHRKRRRERQKQINADLTKALSGGKHE